MKSSWALFHILGKESQTSQASISHRQTKVQGCDSIYQLVKGKINGEIYHLGGHRGNINGNKISLEYLHKLLLGTLCILRNKGKAVDKPFCMGSGILHSCSSIWKEKKSKVVAHDGSIWYQWRTVICAPWPPATYTTTVSQSLFFMPQPYKQLSSSLGLRTYLLYFCVSYDIKQETVWLSGNLKQPHHLTIILKTLR